MEEEKNPACDEIKELETDGQVYLSGHVSGALWHLLLKD